jgi:cation-transporting ATPase E
MSVASLPAGLSAAAVAARVAEHRTNDIGLRSSRSYIDILFTNVFTIYNFILIGSALLVLWLQGSKDVLVATGLVCLNIVIGLFQEVRAKIVLDKLAAITAHSILVRRDGVDKAIPLQSIVQDDIIVLRPGDPIVVDGVAVAADSLEVDESSLSGESEYVVKKSGDTLTSGSFCASGSGYLRAVRVGKRSYLSEFMRTARSFKLSRTPIEKWLSHTFQLLIICIVVLGPLTVVAGLNQDLPFTGALVNFVNLVSSLLPQGLIISVTILFAYGVIRISQFRTLVQRLNAVESMGHLTTLCFDKTGTLTKNELTVEAMATLPEAGSAATVWAKIGQYVQHVSWQNRTLQALQAAVNEQKITLAATEKVAEVPFTAERRWGAIQIGQDGTYILGAPEVLVHDEVTWQAVQTFTRKGLRVLVFAQSADTDSLRARTLPNDIQPLAIVALRDELRPNIVSTLADFARQKIAIKVISGDSLETVQAVAKLAGLANSEAGVTGSELEALHELKFQRKVRETTLFGRISPQLKRRIITTLMKQGQHVAMVGDGVNDVPALKQANVAIAMNNGAQVTKDVADLILLDNAFAVLPKAIREGREITQRIYAVMKIFFVKVVYLIVLFVLAGFANLPFPLSIRQTTWLGFIVVGIPTTLIAFQFLKPALTKGNQDVARYSLLAGGLCGIAMTLLAVLVQMVLQEDPDVSQTLLLIFAALYSTLVLFQIHGISILSLKSMRENLPATLTLSALGLVAILVPMRIAPVAFLSAPLEVWYWVLLALLIGGCGVILRIGWKKLYRFIR